MNCVEFEDKILQNIKTCTTTNRVAVALSGGSDSLALTIAISRVGVEVLAILVNHNLRKEAQAEIDRTIQTLIKYNIKYCIEEWNGVVKKNLEAEARKNRYALLIDACKKNGIDTLCIGHHMDDQVETFLLNLARGSGLDGLCAMPKVLFNNDIKIVRPMLNLTKKDCREYLQNLKINWCEDSSNQDTKYKRNNIRFILEHLDDKELINQRIAKTTEILQEVRNALDWLLEKTVLDLTNKQKKEKIQIELDVFLNFPTYLQRSLLTKLCMQMSSKDYKFRFYQIDNILLSIQQKKSFKRSIGKCFVELKKGKISIFIENKK